jgi:hypothetical protein
MSPQPTPERTRADLQAKVIAALNTMDPDLGDMPAMVKTMKAVLEMFEPPNPVQFALHLADSYERNAQRIRKALMEIT